MLRFIFDLMWFFVLIPFLGAVIMIAPPRYNNPDRENFVNVTPEVANKEIDSLLCYDADMHNFLSEMSQDSDIYTIKTSLYRNSCFYRVRLLIILGGTDELHRSMYKYSYENDSIYLEEDSTIENNDRLYYECRRKCNAIVKFDSTECLFYRFFRSRKENRAIIEFIYKKYSYTLIYPLIRDNFNENSYSGTLINKDVYHNWILYRNNNLYVPDDL